MVVRSYKSFESKDLAHQHCVLVGCAIICELHDTAAFLHKVDIFGILTVVNDQLIGVEV